MKRERLLELAGVQGVQIDEVVNQKAVKKANKVLMKLDSAIEAAVNAIEDQGPIHRHEAIDIVKDRCDDLLNNVL